MHMISIWKKGSFFKIFLNTEKKISKKGKKVRLQ